MQKIVYSVDDNAGKVRGMGNSGTRRIKKQLEILGLRIEKEIYYQPQSWGHLN